MATAPRPRPGTAQKPSAPTPKIGSPNFGALLAKAPSDVEKPKPLPIGTYLCVVQSLPKQDKSTKKGTEYVEYTLNVLQAADDVDAEALEALGGAAGKTIRATYYLTENSLWRLKEFLVALGMDEADYESLGAMVDDSVGKQLLVTLKHTASQDGQAVFAEIGSVAAVD